MTHLVSRLPAVLVAACGLGLFASSAAAQTQPNVEVTLEATAVSSYAAPAAQVTRNQLSVVLTISPRKTLTYKTYWNGALQRDVEGGWRQGETTTGGATRSVGAWRILPNNRIGYDGRITTNLGSVVVLRYVVQIGAGACAATMSAQTASRGPSRARMADGVEMVVDRRWYENVSCRISSG